MGVVRQVPRVLRPEDQGEEMSERTFGSMMIGIAIFASASISWMLYKGHKEEVRQRPMIEARNAEIQKLSDLAFKSCLKRGGVPIRSPWTWQLKDCK